MCEHCDETRKQMFAEIRDLMNFHRPVNGPVSERIKENVEKMRNEDQFSELTEDEIAMRTDSVRAEMIAQRCAFIATACPGAKFHGEQPSQIMAAWAGGMLRAEMERNPIAVLFGLMGGGILFPSQADEEDATGRDPRD